MLYSPPKASILLKIFLHVVFAVCTIRESRLSSQNEAVLLVVGDFLPKGICSAQICISLRGEMQHIVSQTPWTRLHHHTWECLIALQSCGSPWVWIKTNPYSRNGVQYSVWNGPRHATANAKYFSCAWPHYSSEAGGQTLALFYTWNVNAPRRISGDLT